MSAARCMSRAPAGMDGTPGRPGRSLTTATATTATTTASASKTTTTTTTSTSTSTSTTTRTTITTTTTSITTAAAPTERTTTTIIMQPASPPALQGWQHNVMETLARTEPRLSRRSKNERGEAEANADHSSGRSAAGRSASTGRSNATKTFATIRAVTPDPLDRVGSPHAIMTDVGGLSSTAPSTSESLPSSPQHESPRASRSSPSHRHRDRKDASLRRIPSGFGAAHTMRTSHSPDTGLPRQTSSSSHATLRSQLARPRTRTLETPARPRTGSATLPSRQRTNPLSAHESDARGRTMDPDSGVPSIPTRSPSRLKQAAASRRTEDHARPGTPTRKTPQAPNVDALPSPLPVADAGKVVSLMKVLSGRMMGEVRLQLEAGPAWRHGLCSIDPRSSSLHFEWNGRQQTIARDLSGCQVGCVEGVATGERCVQIAARDSDVVIKIQPDLDADLEPWLAALLVYQQLALSSTSSTRRGPEASSGASRPGIARRESSRQSVVGSIIKVAKLLIWDQGLPHGPCQVVTRTPRRDPHGFTNSWQRISCYLHDDGECKMLTENDVTLLATIELPQLTRCAIQRLDKSVLGEDFCLAIYPQYIPSATAISIFRPIYIALETRVLLEVWFVLLRSFCRPVLHGLASTGVDPSDEPSRSTIDPCRVQKSLSVRIVEAKIRPSEADEAMARLVSGATSRSPRTDDATGDYFAEVVLNDEVRARTSTRTATRRPFWREDYDFTELPSQLSILSILLKRVEAAPSGESPVELVAADAREERVYGAVHIDVEALRLDDDFEHWLDLVDDKQDVVGELYVKIRYDELVVLMSKDYQPVSALLHNFSNGLTQELAQALPAHSKRLTEILMNIFQVSGHCSDWLQMLAEEEIDGLGKEKPITHRLRWSRRLGSNESFGSASDREQTVRAMNRSLDNEANLLFRGNSLLTQSLDFHMRRLGNEYLHDVLEDKVLAINNLNPDCEVDPARLVPGEDLEHNWLLLNTLTTDIWESICASASRCPPEIRHILKYIRSCAEDRFGDHLRTASYTSVSGFLFLRFFCPAILNPKLFGLLPSHPPPRAQRTLTLIAKSIQALANLSTFGQKEPWMEPMNRFLAGNRQKLKDFLNSVCAISNERSTFALPASYSTPITILARLPPMAREGFPSLPYLIDHAANFAALVKLWLENRQDPDMAPSPTSATFAPSAGSQLQAFTDLCVALQERTREHEEQLAKLSAQKRTAVAGHPGSGRAQVDDASPLGERWFDYVKSLSSASSVHSEPHASGYLADLPSDDNTDGPVGSSERLSIEPVEFTRIPQFTASYKDASGHDAAASLSPATKIVSNTGSSNTTSTSRTRKSKRDKGRSLSLASSSGGGGGIGGGSASNSSVVHPRDTSLSDLSRRRGSNSTTATTHTHSTAASATTLSAYPFPPMAFPPNHEPPSAVAVAFGQLASVRSRTSDRDRERDRESNHGAHHDAATISSSGSGSNSGKSKGLLGSWGIGK